MQLVEDPAGYYDHIRRYSTAVILASVFGQRGARFDSPKIQALYHVQDQFTAILEQGATPPVDAFPFLQFLPEFMCSWKSRAKKIRKLQQSLYFDLLNETKDRIRSGKGDCFMKQVLEHQEKNELDDEHVAYLGGILVCCGAISSLCVSVANRTRWKLAQILRHLRFSLSYWQCLSTQRP